MVISHKSASKSQAKFVQKQAYSHAKKVVSHMTSAQFGWLVRHCRSIGQPGYTWQLSQYVIVSQMDLQKINRPQDYNKLYHTSSEGLVWLDGKGNPIPLSHMLGAQVEAIGPTELWNSIQTRSKVHRQNIPVLGHGPTNSTAIDPNTPLLTTPTSPIMDHHVEVNQPEWSSMAMVKD